MSVVITTPAKGPRVKDPELRKQLDELTGCVHTDLENLAAQGITPGPKGDKGDPGGGATGSCGTLANRPSFGNKGTLYLVDGDPNDDNNRILWFDTGTAWIAVAGAA
jgi:hypothetical protein